MKHLLFLLLLAGLFFISCSNEDSIVCPDQQSSNNVPAIVGEANLAESLPESIPIHFKKGKTTGLTVTGLIKAKRRSDLTMNAVYREDGHRKVKVYSKIQFPAHAVDEDVEITMTFDPVTGIFSFSPSMTFNKAAKLTVNLKGLDLTGIDPKGIVFIYYAADGTLEYVDHSNIGINLKKGELKVKNIKIQHFSRFGFVR